MKSRGKNNFTKKKVALLSHLVYYICVTIRTNRNRNGDKDYTTNFNKIMYDLFHMKVQSKTTKDILMYIIKTFGINQIAVYKVDNKEETLIPVENGSMKGTPVIIPKFKTLLELPYDEQGLFYRNHYKDELSEPCTFMCLKIEKNDELVGYITFKDDNPSYYWTNEEIQSIAILAYYICDDLYISERA